MADPVLGLQSSLGFIVPNLSGAYIQNPGYSSSDPPSVGPVSVGSYDYNTILKKAYGDFEPNVMRGTTVIASPYFTYGNRSYVGYYATMDSGSGKLYFVDCNAPSVLDGSTAVVVSNGLNSTYAAVQVCEFSESDLVEERTWDESPTTDNDDPGNILPQGGAFADTDGFYETDTVDLTSMGYLENDTDIVFDYSSFLTHYVLTPSNMAALGTAIFLPDFWQSLDNKFAGLSDPMNLIVSAVELPFSYNDTATYFQMGGVTVAPSAGQTIACFKTSARYRSFSCGSRTIREVWGSAKDYTDVQVQLYLPYCGVKELDPDLVINHTVTIRANVDMITGDLVYLVETSNTGLQGTYFQQTSIPYRFTGNCGKQVPIGRFDNSNAILGAIGLMVGAAAGGIGMAAGAGAAAAAGSSAAAGTAAEAAGLIGGGLSFLQHGLQARANTSGGVSGTYGVMDVKYPFMIIKRCVPKYPNGWRDTIGAPRYQTFSGTDMHGFTLFSDIHLPGVPGLTDEEMMQLERELKTEGVIL